MQTVSGYSSAGDSLQPTQEVRIDGVKVDARSVSVTREVASNLPVQIAGGSGIVSATGDVDFVPAQDVVTRFTLPWEDANGMPRKGQPVTIDAGYDEVNPRIFTGVVQDNTGGALGSVGVGVQDGISRLNRTFSMGALADIMVTESIRRRVSVHGTYLVDRLLRHCGFYATPGPWSGQFFSAPLMGSTWQERGPIATSHKFGNIGAGPIWEASPWGIAPTDLQATYTPDFSASGGNDGKFSSNIQMTLMVGEKSGASSSSVFALYWSSHYLRLAITSGGTVVVQTYDGATVTSGPSMASVPGRVYSALVTPGGDVTIRDSEGNTASGTVAPTSTMTGTVMTSVTISVPPGGYPFGGAQAAFSSVYMSATPLTASVSMSKAGYLWAIPAIESTPAIELLKAHAEAECAAFWLDEHGVLVWRNRDDLSSTDYGETLTPEAHIRDVGWEESTGSVRRRAIVAYKESVLTARLAPTITVWQAGGETYSSGDSEEIIISVPDDEDWILLDSSVATLGETGTAGRFNAGRDSFIGGILVEEGELEQAADAGHVSAALSSISARAYKLSITVGSLPAGKEITLKAWDTASITRSQKNLEMPILRAFEKVARTDATATSATTGPDWAPDFEHDVGWFIQNSVAAQELADWLSSQTLVPVASIRSLPVIPDDRRQLGDIVQLDFGTNYPKLVCVVTGITNGLSASDSGIEKTQDLSVRVITVTQGVATLRAHDRSFRGDTLDSQDAYYAGQTLDQHDADPLKT